MIRKNHFFTSSLQSYIPSLVVDLQTYTHQPHIVRILEHQIVLMEKMSNFLIYPAKTSDASKKINTKYELSYAEQSLHELKGLKEFLIYRIKSSACLSISDDDEKALQNIFARDYGRCLNAVSRLIDLLLSKLLDINSDLIPERTEYECENITKNSPYQNFFNDTKDLISKLKITDQ